MSGWNILSQVPESCSINPRVIDETSNFDGKGDGEELERKKERKKEKKTDRKEERISTMKNLMYSLTLNTVRIQKWEEHEPWMVFISSYNCMDKTFISTRGPVSIIPETHPYLYFSKG